LVKIPQITKIRGVSIAGKGSTSPEYAVNEYIDNKKSHLTYVKWFFLKVNPLVQNSNSFLEDLRRLNQLKDSLYQSYEIVKKAKRPLSSTKVGKLKK